jgi:Flp pilus assembly pilin Flp
MLQQRSSPTGCTTPGLQKQERLAGMSYLPNEEGQGLVEYALIIASIAILAIVALLLAGVNVVALYADITGKIGGLFSIGSL